MAPPLRQSTPLALALALTPLPLLSLWLPLPQRRGLTVLPRLPEPAPSRPWEPEGFELAWTWAHSVGAGSRGSCEPRRPLL